MASKRAWLIAALVPMASGCRRGEGVEVRAAKGKEGDALAAQQVSCGKVLCGLGEVCCNPSCGICTAPEGMCTQQFCDEVPPGAKAGEPLPPRQTLSCDNVRCKEGTHCEMVAVQCVRAPCEPVPQCRPDAPAPAKR